MGCISQTFSGHFLWELQRSRIKQKNSQRDMRKQQHRKADDKIPMPRFMAKQIHPEQTAKTSAESRHQKQRFFRDTPLSLLCKALIGIHKNERKQIHTQKISRVEIEHTIISPFGGVL